MEQRFDRNVAEYRDRVTKLRGRSTQCVARLHANGASQFDLIYIDGSHYADDVMADAVLSWPLLRKDGFMIFDDYIWLDSRYGHEKSSTRAIHLFLRLIAGEHEVRHAAHQVIIVKTRSIRTEQPMRQPPSLAAAG